MSCPSHVTFGFYEVGVEVVASFEVVQRLKQDFHYFLAKRDSSNCFRLTLVNSVDTPLGWKEKLDAGRFQLFRSPKRVRRVGFFKKAWVEYRYPKSATVYSTDRIAGYETLFLTLLSFVGEALDEKGWHRLHGYGLQFGEEGAVVMAASGTGKSTLAMEMIEHSEAKILSDDTPLVSGDGMRAFPQRIALKEKPSVPDTFLHTFEREGHGKKYVLGSSYFAEKICDRSSIAWLFLAKRSKSAAVKELSKWHLVWPLFKWLVVGYETPQIWPLYVRGVGGKLKILKSRIRAARQLFSQVRVASLGLSANPRETRHALESFYGEMKI